MKKLIFVLFLFFTLMGWTVFTQAGIIDSVREALKNLQNNCPRDVGGVKGKKGSDGVCCANNLAYDSDEKKYRLIDNKHCGCPTDKDGKTGKPGTNEWTCCADNLSYDSYDNAYQFTDAKHCGCPTDKSGQTGVPGKDDWSCCLNNKAYNTFDNTYNLTNANCGCPKSKDGRAGTPGKNNSPACCLDHLVYNDDSQSYTSIDANACGCPDDAEEKDGVCCKDGKGLICVPAYDSPNEEGKCYYMSGLAPCGCPENGEGKNGICCKDGKRWNISVDPSTGMAIEYGYLYYDPLCGSCPVDKDGRQGRLVETEEYGDICCLEDKLYSTWSFSYDSTNALCGCPDGGEPAEDEQTCCKNNFAYGIDDYDEFDKAQCGCPEGGEEKGDFCCKDGRSYECQEKDDKQECSFSEINAVCGCPTDKNGNTGSPGKNGTSCCVNNLGYDEQKNTYSIVSAYSCGCPKGTEEKDGVCCKDGREYDGTRNGSTNAICGCPVGKDGVSGSRGSTDVNCCRNGWAWNEQDQDYTEFNDYACGCPDNGTLTELWEGANINICCKNHKEYNSKTKQYDLENTDCGCPDDEEETEGHCCPIGSVWIDDEQQEAKE